MMDPDDPTSLFVKSKTSNSDVIGEDKNTEEHITYSDPVAGSSTETLTHKVKKTHV